MWCMLLQVKLQIGFRDVWKAGLCVGGVTLRETHCFSATTGTSVVMKVKGFSLQLTNGLFVAPPGDHAAVSASL